MKNNKSFQKQTLKLTGQECKGLLVSTFGAEADVETVDGTIVRCHIRKNIETVVTGDQVLYLADKNGCGVVVGHLPRKSLLCRPENSHKMKLVAANIDSIVIVTAPPPNLSEEMLDRYLVAAELLTIKPIILMNKIDLVNDEEQQKLIARLNEYKKIGYPVIFSSSLTEAGLTELIDYLQDKTCVLVGASGVGKSSIIAKLTANSSIRIGEVSTGTQLGKHTTTNTRLYHLAQGGNLIDSPGVREFGLWHIEPHELPLGFVEFKEFIGQCKYRDCQHQREPHCALQQAVANQQISKKRFEHFIHLSAALMGKRK